MEEDRREEEGVIFQCRIDSYFSEFLGYYYQELFTDCNIVSREGIFSVHRVLLAAGCPILRQAMRDNIADPELTLLMPDFTIEDISSLIGLLYGITQERELVPVTPAIITNLLVDIEINSDDAGREGSKNCLEFRVPREISELRSAIKSRKMERDESEMKNQIKLTLDPSSKSSRKKCHLCFVTRKTEAELLEHVEDTHGQNLFSVTLDLVSDLKLKTFKCCDFVFFDKLRWERHRLKIHLKSVLSLRQSMKCENCDNNFSFNQELVDSTFKSGVDGRSCPVCAKEIEGKKFRQSLFRHLNSDCDGLLKLSCPFCSSKLIQIPDEISNQEEEEEEESKNGNFKRRRPKTKKCSHCDSVFGRFDDLEMHMKRAHEIHSIYPCNLCGKTFSTLRRLTLHANVHEEKVICDICKKAFTCPSALKQHLFTHKSEIAVKSFKCDFCEKTFNSNYRKNDHMNIHTGNKPHLCENCGYKCHLQSGMAHHIKRCLKVNSNFEPIKL